MSTVSHTLAQRIAGLERAAARLRTHYTETPSPSRGQRFLFATTALFMGFLMGLTPLFVSSASTTEAAGAQYTVPGLTFVRTEGTKAFYDLQLPIVGWEPWDGVPDTVGMERESETSVNVDPHAVVIRERQRRDMARYIAETYRIDPLAALLIVEVAQDVSQRYDLDPGLLLAVTAIESRFNPLAGSYVGAAGFTQIMASAHPEKVAHIRAEGYSLLDPAVNMHVGGWVLREYLNWHKGDVRRALQQYNGNLADTQQRYATRVLNVKMALDGSLRDPWHEEQWAHVAPNRTTPPRFSLRNYGAPVRREPGTPGRG